MTSCLFSDIILSQSFLSLSIDCFNSLYYFSVKRIYSPKAPIGIYSEYTWLRVKMKEQVN